LVSGEANLGYIDQNNQRLTQIRLREGDVYQIPAGSAFYIANEESDQKLEIISGIEPSQGLGDDVFQVHGRIIIKSFLVFYIFITLKENKKYATDFTLINLPTLCVACSLSILEEEQIQDFLDSRKKSLKLLLT